MDKLLGFWTMTFGVVLMITPLQGGNIPEKLMIACYEMFCFGLILVGIYFFMGGWC